MDPLLDEILAAEAEAAEVAARLAKLVRLLRDAEALGRRLRPLAADAEREAGCAAG